ncbi:MAG TPA: hypothetical protein VLS89_14160 [Candidatus Nanopelagicales bacterium]|nr:hypothetical protein [Candidatus Nanopelagicales bacterium]
MSTTRDDLARSLADVRRAYRLVQLYHRRLCDLLQTVDDTLTRGGLEFDRWDPQNVARLPKAGKPFFRPEHWAWDLTPAYQVRCSWEQATKGQSRRVDLDLIADTGFAPTGEGEPDPGAFVDAERSATELHVGLWTARAKRAAWGEAWTRLEAFQDVFDGKPHTVDIDGVGHTFRHLRVDVADLVDAQAMKARLLDPIEQWLREPGSAAV